MGKHRKTQHFRRMVIGAVAVGTVGVPSVALACTDWPSGTTDRSAAATGATALGLADTPAPTETATATAGQTAIPQQPGMSQAIPKQRAHHHHPRPLPKAPGAPLTTAAPQTAAAQQGSTPPAAPAEQTDAPAPAPAASSAPATATPSADTASADTASGVTAQIVRLVNAERAKAGCRPLTLDAKLTKAAQEHSADMAAHQNMSHTGSDGSDPGTRITQAGYTWSAYGENVAYGYSTAAEVMAGWMSSPGHRANILNCGYQEIGVGLAQPDSYWTQDFGTAR
ncbi:CAP domain-containing protein [Streptomyces sp. LaBMicrA B280]|uniref:CAP domain-containing protein n=1 Tax=Streptomyces sp. LaBMicrA B280 TaxID=3391001 RepID=UPI003BA519F6